MRTFVLASVTLAYAVSTRLFNSRGIVKVCQASLILRTHADVLTVFSNRWKHLRSPPGYLDVPATVWHLLRPGLLPLRPHQVKGPSKSVRPDAYDKIKEKKAWDFAISPAKSLPMQAFMLYMSGGGVQIFSISIVFMLLLTPFRNLAGINSGEALLENTS